MKGDREWMDGRELYGRDCMEGSKEWIEGMDGRDGWKGGLEGRMEGRKG